MPPDRGSAIPPPGRRCPSCDRPPGHGFPIHPHRRYTCSAPSPRACATVACRRRLRGQQEGAGVRQPASVTDSGSRVRVAGAGRGFGRDTGRWVVRRCARWGSGPCEERLLPVQGPGLAWIANRGRASASRRGSVNPVGRWSSYPGSRHTGSPCRFSGTVATVRAQGRDGRNDGPTRRAVMSIRVAISSRFRRSVVHGAGPGSVPGSPSS